MKKISNAGKKAGFLAALLLAGTLAGCGSKTAGGNSSASSTEVTLNEVAHSIFYAPMYVAIEEGFFEEEGIDVENAQGDEILEADEVFDIGDGRYLIVEG